MIIGHCPLCWYIGNGEIWTETIKAMQVWCHAMQV